MKVITPNCRVQFTAEDIEFITGVLGKRSSESEFLTQLLGDESSRIAALRRLFGEAGR